MRRGGCLSVRRVQKCVMALLNLSSKSAILGRLLELNIALTQSEQGGHMTEADIDQVRDAFDAACKSRVEAALKAEREACAKVGDKHLKNWTRLAGKDTAYKWLEKLAAAIRARGNT